ncbi:MAG: hypothetical protein H3C54_09990 [Taibaiella sp.]|nr:hypothetical protein [Taibaiella sp.]
MRTLYITLLAFLFTVNASAQNDVTENVTPAQDTIKILKNFWGTTYHEGWKQINLKRLSNIVKPNEEAYKYIQKARAHNAVANIFAFAGGFAIGWSLADIAIKGEVTPGVLIAGGAATLISIPFSMSAAAHTKMAVEKYNHDLLHPETAYRKPQLQLGFTGGGVGLALRF